MARLELFVVSEEVSIDQTTNQTSVFSILEEIRPFGFPTLVFKCAAISLWRREPGDEERDFQVVLRLTPPEGETRDFTTNFRLTRPRHRIVQRIQGLPLTRAGVLRFEILLNGAHAAEHIITVEEARPLDVAGTAVAH